VRLPPSSRVIAANGGGAGGEAGSAGHELCHGGGRSVCGEGRVTAGRRWQRPRLPLTLADSTTLSLVLLSHIVRCGLALFCRRVRGGRPRRGCSAAAASHRSCHSRPSPQAPVGALGPRGATLPLCGRSRWPQPLQLAVLSLCSAR
jgi:hypothetical protein